MDVSLQSVSRAVGGEDYLYDIDLQLESGSRHVILGRTLAGKTTLLRVLAGLDRPTKGKVFVNGKDVTGAPVRDRSVAMVYQQFINYPFWSVYRNIASPLHVQRVPKSEIRARIGEVAAMLRIEDLLDRKPSELSGGQQQRVAIARALVKDADLLLLDEPLVNLDFKLREQLREELQAIFGQGKATVVYTTTEPVEALMLGGNVVVLDEGRVQQAGPTPEVYHHPDTVRVAEVFSDPPMNYFTASVSGNQALLADEVRLPLNEHLGGLKDGSYAFGIRANQLSLDRPGAGMVEVSAVVELSEINGSETFTHVRFRDHRMVIQEDGIRGRRIGSKVTLFVRPGHFFVYDENGQLVASPRNVRMATNA